jgi:hypothetical protein
MTGDAIVIFVDRRGSCKRLGRRALRRRVLVSLVTGATFMFFSLVVVKTVSTPAGRQPAPGTSPPGAG